MRKIISAVIIDSKESEHDYNTIQTEGFYIGEETRIDTYIVASSQGILETLNRQQGFDALISIGEVDFEPLNELSFEYRKKWVHLNEFNKDEIVGSIIATFKNNILRDRGEDKLFSVFTCTYHTPKEFIDRLYNSLKAQTYHNWNWFIIDDSTNSNTFRYLESLRDPRITVIKNVTHHGNIGFNKHVIASICDGDYLVEIDHDDELTPNCFEKLYGAFQKFNADFVYSYAMEWVDNAPVYYDLPFALGLGRYEKLPVNGVEYDIATTADVNALSLRHIVGLPNHVRCWKKEFYHKIGGHNMELSVLDDMDILIRTFLNDAVMVKIPEVLYIQHEGESSDGKRGSTTQSNRMGEILRLGKILKEKYDLPLHEKIVEKCGIDAVWNENLQESAIYWDELPDLVNFNEIYK